MKGKRRILKLFLTAIIALSAVITAIPVNGLVNGRNTHYDNSINELIDKLNNEIPVLMKKYNVPGASVALINNGEIVWNQGFGFSDKSKGIKVTEDTVFQAASISKPTTAIGVMKLVEEGKIDLDAPIEKYLTKWKFPVSDYNSEAVTVKSLLSHTGGLSVGGYAGYKPDGELPDLLDSLSGKTYKGYKVELIAEPGTQFMYSGGGFSVLQLLIEEVSGMTYSEYMQQNVLNEMKMTNSSFEWKDDIKAKTSKAYGALGEEIENYLFAEKAAAGLYTTANDLAKLCISMMNPGYRKTTSESFLTDATISTMLTSVTLSNSSSVNYGLGFSTFKDGKGDRIISHNGDNRGWSSRMIFRPEKGAGIVVLTNSYYGDQLRRDITGYWEEAITGVMPKYYYERRNLESMIIMITIGILAVILLCLAKVLVNLRKGKRIIIFASRTANKTPVIIKLVLLTFIIAAWWVGFYAPWYNNGWTIAPFLPLGFNFLTKMITLYLVIFMIISLIPKVKSTTINCD